MKSVARTFALLGMFSLGIAFAVNVQGDDKETAAALKQAADAAKAMGVEMPDVKSMLDEAEKEGVKAKPAKVPAIKMGPAGIGATEKKSIAKGAGPVALPTWTPAVLQFTPDGTVSRKMIGNSEEIAQTGTSPLTPAELADAWQAVKIDQVTNSRRNNRFNGNITVIVYLRSQGDKREQVRLIAERPEAAKITKVTLASPLPDESGDD